MIKQFVKNIIRELRFISHIGAESKEISYSQSGEDIIIDFIFSVYLKDKKMYYLDIGAHHPYYLSNTARFYKKGFVGILVEPDPFLYKKIKESRPKDICINLGVSIDDNESELDFYIIQPPTLNTFSKEEAERYQKSGHEIVGKAKVGIININKIIERYAKEEVSFISLDIEGLDLDVLKSFDFNRYRPSVFCIETAVYSNNKIPEKSREIHEIMSHNGYIVYADTYINTIFIDKQAWENSYQNHKNHV